MSKKVRDDDNERSESKPKSKLTRLIIRAAWSIALLIFTLIIVLLAKASPEKVERIYSNGVFLYASGLISAVTSVLPFSVAEILVYLVAVGVVIFVVVTVNNIINHKFRLFSLLSAAVGILAFVSSALFLFYALWGLNHFRVPLETTLMMDISTEYTSEELSVFCGYLAQNANEIRETLPENELGVFTIDNEAALNTEIQSIYKSRYVERGAPYRRRLANVKHPMWKNAMSYMNISGMFIPYTAEVTINAAQPSLLIPASAAHEYAHLLGYAGEDEANYLAYSICTQATSGEIRYSGYMLALMTCGNRLHNENEAMYDELIAALSDKVRCDLTSYSAYWNGYEGSLSELASDINDAYLFGNGQNGVESYNDSADFMLCDYYAAI